MPRHTSLHAVPAAQAGSSGDGAAAAATVGAAEALSWVQAARAVAIERFPYLDTALSAMIPYARPGLGTVATDARWRYYYDPVRVLAQAAPRGGGLDAMVSDWVHEVGHLLRDHPSRWADLAEPVERHPLFNIAGDALINADLADLHLPLLLTDITCESLRHVGARRDMTTEELYLRLREHAEQRRKSGGAVAAAPRDCGSGAGGERRPWEEPDPGSPVAHDALGPGPGLATGGGSGGSRVPDDGSVDPGRGDLIREETAVKIRQHGRSSRHGDLPAGLRHWAEALLDPVVDWRRELRSFVSRNLGAAAGRRDYAWDQRSRRRVPGYVMPGMAAPLPPSVAVVVDTSGSMSPDDLAQCLTDLSALTRAAAGIAGSRPVRVLACDTSVGDVQHIRGRHDIPRVELTGGGGTDMGAGLRAAAALRPTPEVVVVLTDGWTPWPDTPPAEAPRAAYVAVLLGDQSAPADSTPHWIHAIEADQ